MSRYRGRRRGVSPLMLLIALVVAIAAVVLIIINLGKDKKPANDDANTPPATGDTTDPGNTDDPNAADPVTPDDTTPTYQKIELQGDQQQYDAVYRVGDTGYEMYSYVDSTAKKYADNVNAVADALAGKANVYMLPIPPELRYLPAGRAVRQGYLRRPEGRRAEDHRLHERQCEVRGAV